MKYLYILLITIISLPLSAQTCGQEYLPNPGVCTTTNTAAGCDTTGVDGSGNLSAANRYGTSAHNGAAYGAIADANGNPNANAPAYYGNRVYKLFKKGNATDPQFVAFDTTVPPGNYTYSIYTRWPAAVDYDAGAAKKPFLRIKGHGNSDANDNSSLVDVVPNNSAGTTAEDWIQTTGQVTIPAASDGSDLNIRFSVGKLGGSNASPTNLAEILLVDFISLKYESSSNNASALELKGVIDFSLPGKWLKGVHLKATADISDMSAYGIGVYSNGATTENENVALSGSAQAGDDIFVWDTAAIERFEDLSRAGADLYMNASNIFTQSIHNESMDGFNGDDALTLTKDGAVIETFGVIGTDGTGEAWEYTDTWAFKGADGTWTYGTVDCTDGSYRMYDSGCVYPHAVDKQALGASTDLIEAFDVTFQDGLSGIKGPIVTSDGTDYQTFKEAGWWFNEAEAPIIRVTSSGAAGEKAMQYLDDGTYNYSNMQIQFNSKIDMNKLNTISLRAYIDSSTLSGSQTNQLALKLQDSSENEPWTNQNTVVQEISATDQWVDLVFTFNDTASMSRDDVDRIVVQFNGEGNNDTVTAYINTVVGSYTAPVTVTPPTPNANLVVTFEGNDINSDALNLGGTTGTAIVTDPTDSSNKVLKIEYVDGPGWGNNAGFDIPTGMKAVVANTITFDIWSDHSSSATQEDGYGYMLKLEQPEGSIEKSFKADGAGAWQTVTIDLSNCDYKHPTGNCGGQENAGNQFTRFLLFHWGGSNPSSSYPDTIYIDNIKYDEGQTLGLADVNLADAIVVYPNPTNGIVNISGVEKVDAIRAFSISGQLIKETVNANSLDLSSERKGLYMIKIEHEGQTTVNKLIVR